MLLVKNAEVYAPEYLGKKDVLICGRRIEQIQDTIGALPVECRCWMRQASFLRRDLSISMSTLQEAEEKEASIRGRRSFSFQSW